MESLRDTIRQFCRDCHLKLNTDMGQHFLIDQEILDQIIAAAKIEPTDHVVEIGPGMGILTKELVARAEKVTAIELDRRMVPMLLIYTQQPKNLVIVNDNALKTEYPNEPYKIVANIPYHITSPLLRKTFLESPVHPKSLTLLIQREVAEKIVDQEDAGILTVLVGLFGTPKLITLVPPEAFLPPPKVDSAVLQIDCFETPLADAATIERIFGLVSAAFSQKRKMLRNTLGAFPGGMERLEALGIDPTRRPQTLSVAEWIHLAEAMKED